MHRKKPVQCYLNTLRTTFNRKNPMQCCPRSFRKKIQVLLSRQQLATPSGHSIYMRHVTKKYEDILPIKDSLHTTIFSKYTELLHLKYIFRIL